MTAMVLVFLMGACIGFAVGQLLTVWMDGKLDGKK